MKVTSVGLAKALWFLDLNETNPGGKDFFFDLVPALVEDYQFKKYPQPGGDFHDGMKFENGFFTNEKNVRMPVSLAVFQDGIAGDTYSSTDDSDEFLAEISSTLLALGYTFESSMISRKAYTSQLHLRSERSLSAFNPALEAFAERITQKGAGAFGFAAIEFWPDQTQVLKPANFSFQRRAGDSFSSNRYWSQAPLRTPDHIELLDELEKILSS